MPYRNSFRASAAATLLTLSACATPAPCLSPRPPADMMQPPQETDFLGRIRSLLWTSSISPE